MSLADFDAAVANIQAITGDTTFSGAAFTPHCVVAETIAFSEPQKPLLRAYENRHAKDSDLAF